MRDRDYSTNQEAKRQYIDRVVSAEKPKKDPHKGEKSKRGISPEEREEFFKKQALNAKKAEHPQKAMVVPFGGAHFYLQDIKNNCLDPESGFPKRKIMPQETPYKPYKESGSLWKKVGYAGLSAALALGVGSWLLSGCETPNYTLEELREKDREETNRLVEESKEDAERIKKGLVKAEVYIKGFNQNPAEWGILPMPENSYREGAGKNYKLVVGIDSLYAKEKGRTVVTMKQKGDFDLIGIRTGSGTFYGEPGKDIGVGITPDELYNLLDNNEVPFQAFGMKYDRENNTLMEICGSYRNGFFKIGKNFLYIGDKPLPKK